jgi:uncharacterized membrane protein
MERIKGAIRKTFFAGLVVVIPIALTAVALVWLFRVLDGFVINPILQRVWGINIPGLGLLTGIVIIFLVGAVTTNFLGARLLKLVQDLLMCIPVVRKIYPTIQQVVEAFSPSSESSFKKVVMVEYPQKGVWSLGFLTNEVTVIGAGGSNRFICVYIPTNNLYLGHVALFKAEEVILTQFSVEEGLKIILSGGKAFPGVIKGPPGKILP